MTKTVYKLYAVGTTSPDPEKWRAWDEVSIVVARDALQAMELGEGAICVEIPMDRPLYLLGMPIFVMDME